VTADDLRRIRFPLAFRGYRMAEVDALIDRLAEELEAGARAAERTPEDGEDGTP
jgi:DivIVA domain-containing protein